MFMRCFVAIEIPREEKVTIKKAQNMFTRFSSVRLLNESLLHLTLEFLGDLEEKEVILVKKAMKLAVTGKPRFSCTGGKICVFPSESFFRVICIELEKSDALHELQKDLSSKICCELGNENHPAERNFVPHITFARVKSMQEKEKILTAISAANNKAQKISFDVKEIILMQSVLGPAGVTYKALEKNKLGN